MFFHRALQQSRAEDRNRGIEKALLGVRAARREWKSRPEERRRRRRRRRRGGGGGEGGALSGPSP